MFQFPGCPPAGLCVQPAVLEHYLEWVTPFRNRRIIVCFQLPWRLSQVATSFFGSWCLGIHLGPLLACSTYNHSSIAEERPIGHVNFRTSNSKEDPEFAYGILEISIDLFGCQCAGGDERIRTADPLLAKQVLSQLSYIPWGALFRAIATSNNRRLPPHADRIGPAGGFQTLKV
jgi:hypothetical protein